MTGDAKMFNVFEVPLALIVKMLVFWSVALHSFVRRYRWFGTELRPLSG